MKDFLLTPDERSLVTVERFNLSRTWYMSMDAGTYPDGFNRSPTPTVFEYNVIRDLTRHHSLDIAIAAFCCNLAPVRSSIEPTFTQRQLGCNGCAIILY